MCCFQYVFFKCQTLKNTLLIVLYGGIIEWWSKRLTVFRVSELSSMIIICEGRGSRDSEQNKKQMRLLQIFFGHAGDREVLNLLPRQNTAVHCYLKPHEYRYSHTCIKRSPTGNGGVTA